MLLLSESCSAAAHNLSLADQLCAELGTVESQVDIKVNTIEGTLRRIHSFKILLKILPGEI
jgi:hypothetical protein